jgi:hypothetical protein
MGKVGAYVALRRRRRKLGLLVGRLADIAGQAWLY